MRVVASLAHDGDDLPNFGRIGGVAKTLVSRRSPSVEAGHGRRRSTSTSAVKQHLGHGPSSGSQNEPRASVASNRSVTEAAARPKRCDGAPTTAARPRQQPARRRARCRCHAKAIANSARGATPAFRPTRTCARGRSRRSLFGESSRASVHLGCRPLPDVSCQRPRDWRVCLRHCRVNRTPTGSSPNVNTAGREDRHCTGGAPLPDGV